MQKTSNLVLISAIFTLLLTPLVFLGLDFTDLGYHITNQMQAQEFGLTHLRYNPYWGGADIFGSFWLYLFGGELWTIRLFAVVLYALSFWLFLRESGGSTSFIILMGIGFLSSMPTSGGMILVADYYTLPMAGMIIWGLLWIRFLESSDSWIFTTSLFVLTCVLTFLRLPLVALFFIPFLSLGSTKKIIGLRWAGLCTILVILVSISGIPKELIESLAITQNHKISSTISSFISSSLRDLRENTFFILQLGIIAMIVSKVLRKPMKDLVLMILIVLLPISILYSMGFLNNIPVVSAIGKSAFKRTTVSLHLILSFYTFSLLLKDRAKLLGYGVLLLLPYILIAGTNTGFAKLNYLITMTFIALQAVTKISIPKAWQIVFLISTLLFNYSRFYRDGNVRELILPPINEPSLEHIITTQTNSNRAKAISHFFRDNQLRKKTILTYPKLATAYYMNASLPYLHKPWSYIFKDEYLESELKKDCAALKLAAVIIQEGSIPWEHVLNSVKKNCMVVSETKSGDLHFILLSSR